MKKLSVLLSVLLIITLFVGCGGDKVKAPPSSSTPASPNAPVETPPKGEPSGRITEDRAKEIAFERAGVNAADASRVSVEYDYDDDRGLWEYSVEFYVGATEYDVEIDAVSGVVLEFDKD